MTSAEIASVVSAISAAVAAGAAVAAVVVASKQLEKLNNTLRMNGLMAVLQLEADMTARKMRVDDLAAEIRKEDSKISPNAALITILGDQMNGYLENWLNASDRLAYCILKRYLPERDWRAEYRPYFAELVCDHAPKFGPGSLYTNIIDLNNKWQRE